MIKQTFLFISLFAFLNCTNNENLENCIQAFPLNINTDLTLPQLINAQTPTGFAELPGGAKGIILLNVNGTDFVAYDRLCPNDNCVTPMSYNKDRFILKCACDESEYAIAGGIGGAPQTEGFLCPAIEYRVLKRGTSIRITNF